MKKRNKVLKCIIFLLLGIFIFQTLTYIFVPKWIDYFDSSSARLKGFYNEKRNTIDVLVVGNSDVGRGYSPITVWNKYGITSYNLGTSQQTMAFAYYLIKEAINYQNVKNIVLDMDAVFINDPQEGQYRQFFDNMKFGKAKLEAINDEKLNIEEKEKLSYFFPMLRFHTRWNELKKDDFKFSLKDKYETLSYKGMALNVNIKPYKYDENYMEKGKKQEIPKKNLYYINEIIKLCEEKNIQLLCVVIPSAINGENKQNQPLYDWSISKSKEVENITKEHGIEFIDFNLSQNLKKIELDWNRDSYDGGNHLNVYGAEKFSDYIGKVLSEKYNLEDHRNDKEIADNWNETAKRYENYKEKLEKDNINKEN